MICETCKAEGKKSIVFDRGGKLADEVCGGMYCRACHVSLTFEDCINDVSANALRKQYGLPPMERGDRSTSAKATDE